METVKKRKIYLFLLAIGGLLISFTACGNKTKASTGDADSVDTDTIIDPYFLKHTVEYIQERIDSIYSNFGYVPYNPDDSAVVQAPTNYDSLFCTSNYYKLKAEAMQLSQKRSEVIIDADHWIAGQDIAEDWRYEVRQIDAITDSSATVELNIHNFSDNRVVLDLRFERNDWYVDDFHFFYTDDEGTHELTEQAQMRNYIQDCKENE